MERGNSLRDCLFLFSLPLRKAIAPKDFKPFPKEVFFSALNYTSIPAKNTSSFCLKFPDILP